MVVWRKGHIVLAAGSQLTTPDQRYTLHVNPNNGRNRLEVRDIRPVDAGDYVCQISTGGGKLIEVAHTVEVLGG